MNKFFGAGVAMVTPFEKDGSVDYKSLGRLINFLIDGGIDYLVSLGTTGEAATLSHDEKKKIWAFTAEKVDGRIPLMAGIGGNHTYEVCRQIENFNHEGYEGILSVSPYYNKPNQEGIYQHFKAIAEVSSLPILLYNVPGRTGSHMQVSTIIALANDFNNVIGVKEASGNFDQFNNILKEKPKDFMLISGDDSLTLPLIALGAAGVISVIGNAFPKTLANMVRYGLTNKWEEAQKLHFTLLEITRLCFVDGSPGGVKTALQCLGICENHLRLPLMGPSQKVVQQIQQELKTIKE